MSGLILLALLVLMVVTLVIMLILQQGIKRILLTFGGFLIVIGIFYLYVVKTCGPNPKDVEVMTPQTEVITNYVLKNGVPKSMQEIPNLPYQWDRCERTSKNVEWCYFHVNGNSYGSRLYFLTGSEIFIRTYNEKSETGVSTSLKYQSNDIRFIPKLTPYSTKHDGVCNPMRQ